MTSTRRRKTRLYDTDGKLVRVIEENKVEALGQYKLGKAEFMQVKTRDGFVMEAMMIKPPDFDPSKKYPVMSIHLWRSARAAGAKRLGRHQLHVAPDAGAEGLHHLDLSTTAPPAARERNRRGRFTGISANWSCEISKTDHMAEDATLR